MADMSEEEIAEQQKLHEAIEECVSDQLAGTILSGWVVCYEGTDISGTNSISGSIFGPREMTSWKALGLLEWARRFCIGPEDSKDDD